MSSALDKLNTFIERFRLDYTIGKIDMSKYGAYLKWKFEDSPMPSFYEVVDIAEKVSDNLKKYDIKYPGATSYTEPYLNDDPWQSYKMYGAAQIHLRPIRSCRHQERDAGVWGNNRTAKCGRRMAM